MNSLALALRQVRYENTSFWRNPAAAFFTFVFPLMFLVIFNLVFGNRELDVPGGSVSSSTFYVPAIVALSVTSACYNNVAMGIAFSRDGGLLKRFRGTPLPAWSYLFGRIVHSVLMALLLVVIVTGAGALLYDVDLLPTPCRGSSWRWRSARLLFAPLGWRSRRLYPTRMQRRPLSTRRFCPCSSYRTYSSRCRTPQAGSPPSPTSFP